MAHGVSGYGSTGSAGAGIEANAIFGAEDLGSLRIGHRVGFMSGCESTGSVVAGIETEIICGAEDLGNLRIRPRIDFVFCRFTGVSITSGGGTSFGTFVTSVSRDCSSSGSAAEDSVSDASVLSSSLSAPNFSSCFLNSKSQTLIAATAFSFSPALRNVLAKISQA
jgi:hypothetical protein